MRVTPLVAAAVVVNLLAAPAAQAFSPAAGAPTIDAAAELLDGGSLSFAEGAEELAAAAGTARFDDSAFKVAVFKPQVRSPRKLDVQYVSPWVDAVTVLPGDRFPLRALTPGGKPVSVTWRAKGGKLAYGGDLAVWTAPLEPGAYSVTGTGLVAGRTTSRALTMIVTVPASNVKGGKLNGYPIGTYPRGFGPKPTLVANRGTRGGDDRYSVPAGFVELTKETADVPLSRHYKLREFQGKDAFVGGKKYLFVEPRLVEKLERLIVTLNAAGYPCEKLELMSAYRSPALNRAIGNVTSLSRHTYGDAADMICQDFNRDGKNDYLDAQILLAAVTKLDKETDLTGGAHLYPPTPGHGYFVHTDTRGTLVRW